MRSSRKRLLHRTVLLSLTAALVVGQPMAALAAPDNDDRANATPVTAVPFNDVVDVSDATVEDGEPSPSCGYEVGNTVWYEVTLANRTSLLVDTTGSGYDTVAAVYTPDLEEIACNDDAGSLQARVGFTAERGGTYLVQVGSYGGYLDPEYDDPTLVLSIDRGRAVTRRPQQERYSFRGLIAESFNWDEDGSSGLILQDGRYSSSFSRGQQAVRQVEAWHYQETIDEEKGTYTFVDWWGYAPLTSGDIDRRLRTAYVDQEIELWGYSCTGPIDWDDEEDEVEFDCIDLGSDIAHASAQWTAIGSTTRINSRDRYRDEWGSYSFSYRASSRPANISGGVSGDQVSFSMDGAEAYLADVNYREQMRFRLG